MSSQSNRDNDGKRSRRVTPRTNVLDAWRVLLEPSGYGDFALVDLFQRGYDTWREQGVRNEKQMLDEVQRFVLEAIKKPKQADVVSDPWVPVECPGRLAVMLSMGSLMIQKNEQLQERSHRITLHHYLQDVFAYHVFAAINNFEHPDGNIQVIAGEAVYGRNGNPDARGPPPGRPVTGITQLEDAGSGLYYEVPLVHANQNCLVREGDPVDGELQVKVDNNCVYIPTTGFETAFKKHLIDGRESVVNKLEQTFENTLTDENETTIVNYAEDVHAKIKKLLEANQTQKLFAERRYPERLRVVLKAVDKAPNEVAKLDEPIKAGDIFDAIEWFIEQEPGADEDDVDNDIKSYEQDNVSEFDTARAVSNFLRKYDDHRHVEIQRGKYNRYILEYSPWEHAKKVNVSEIEDIHELPCMENIHHFLQEGKPVRWVLYSYVRIIFSLDNGFEVDDVVDYFRQYPWFDEETSRYQARYEKRRTISGTNEKPLPVGCHNDNQNFSQFCIGLENCDYSIYRSLPFKDAVYDRIPDNDRSTVRNSD
ncbi:primase-associated protein [Halosimplex aquaticum]|uniref:Primase-associated protein n=1 Tax=Halosimplex aquaticum TaxID=3026162 RepID=A0ABD5Y7Y6_9EURY|nr:primase-associated protein [Halosimplex aquaticum]